MADDRISRIGWLTIGLAIVGSLVALASEALRYSRSGVVEWGHVALGIGVPILMYAIVRGASRKLR
jgi:hypothetical protein